MVGSLLLVGGPGRPVNPLPVQPARIHRPPLRPDVLSRERLNGWLEQASGGRLALVVAEAGHGKTTLLADWSRHTRRLTTWYRLEPADRDWLTFIRHLIAGGRELEAAFGIRTLELLQALGPGGPTREELIASIATELADCGRAHAQGLTLILDDYHAVDGSPETDPIVKAILDRTGPGFSVVIASRVPPKLPVGKLRARGGVSRLDEDDLHFDLAETDRLFREAYHRPLDPDVVADLRARTEGWAALLTLVRTNLEEQDEPDPRALVAQLSATGGDLYEFLAEEILAALPPPLQRFLERVSVLTAVDVDVAALVDERSAEEVRDAIREAEHLGLLSRPDRGSPHRFHPLVREFLAARLRDDVGPDAVRRLHLQVADTLAATDWETAAWHYREAGAVEEAAGVVDRAVDRIVASGQFEGARTFLDGSAGPVDRPGALVLRSRLELERGNYARAGELARAAADAAQGTPLAGIALLNLTAILARYGFDEQAIASAHSALQATLTEEQRVIAQATLLLSEAQHEGNLELIADLLRGLATQQDRAGHLRYAGITRVNLASLLLWTGRPDEARAVATQAEKDLAGLAGSAERATASANRLAALLQLGHTEALASLDRLVNHAPSAVARDEAAIEAARLHTDYGSLQQAQAAADQVGSAALSAGYLGGWLLARSVIALRGGDLDSASTLCAEAREAQVFDTCGGLRLRLQRARIGMALSDASAVIDIAELRRIAHAQRSRPGVALGDVLAALASAGSPDAAVSRLAPGDDHLLSVLAEELSRNLSRFGPDARARIEREARTRPARWTTALRLALPFDVQAGALLAEIGSSAEREALRQAAGSDKRLRPFAASLARRLATPVFVRDLGQVVIFLGDRPLDKATRRKVVALLCYLSSRTGMAATRDEALEALWPELSPDTATNSLHQTIYFLRRLFEPEYREWMSAGYVQFDGEVLSLDENLVDTSSRACWRRITAVRQGDMGALDELLAAYTGSYALDFAYEDWAAPYRDNLHAAVLACAEGGVQAASARGDWDRVIHLAHQVLAVDPAADAIELQLIRAYKSTGKNAAAAEQYGHYSAFVRDELGAEPSALDEL